MSNLPSLDKLDPGAAWEPWQPTADDPWSARWAAHLYRRAGFGANRDELKTAVAAGMGATVDRLLAGPKEPPRRDRFGFGPPPTDPMTGQPDPRIDAAMLRANWLGRMIDGADALREKMALFWHNHFATSVRKVGHAGLMETQGELLYKHALGHFRALLRDISRDPAMLVWLDSNENVKGKPNENYAREVMELFSLGVGHYTEYDVREAARAFTGWHTAGGKFAFSPNQHDDGSKTVLGQDGKWDGDDVLRILLDQPACATFVVRKLYQFFVSESAPPPDALLGPLADAFRKSDYDIAVPVRTILRSRVFYSAHAYRQKFKSPVEYAVGVVRAVGVGITGRVTTNPYALLDSLELMGQQLYAPPNVKGWEGGSSWLNTATVLARHNFANALLYSTGDLIQSVRKLRLQTFYPSVDPLSHVRKLGLKDAATVLDFFADVLLPGDLRPAVRTKLVSHIEQGGKETEPFIAGCRDALFVMLTLPEYQLS